jgi:hypothetical protein
MACVNLVAIKVECECGQEHEIPYEDVHTYVSQGCESCGHGGGTEYSWKCPIRGTTVSVSDS